jgi:hypothetical protein
MEAEAGESGVQSHPGHIGRHCLKQNKIKTKNSNGILLHNIRVAGGSVTWDNHTETSLTISYNIPLS